MLVLRRAYLTTTQMAYTICKLRYLMSGQTAPSADSLGLFDSKYHRNGPLQLRRSKAIVALLGEHKERLDQGMVQIEKQRALLLSSGVEVSSSDHYRHKPPHPLLEEYLKRYSALSEVFKVCRLNSEWVYKAVGWYNVLPLYKPLVQRLLLSSGEETQCLLQALSWMTYRWTGAYGMIDEDLRERKQVEQFYYKLSHLLSIEELRSVEEIIVAPLCISKRRYYQAYVANNLDHITKGMQSNDTKGIGNLVWLFYQMVSSMVDHNMLVLKFQKFLLTPGLQLGQETELLLKLYELKGRVNRLVYTQHLKPYLLKNKMRDLGDIIETIKFVVCSECGDNALLKNLYQILQINYQRGSIRHSRHLYDLHLYTHYLRIKGYTIKLPKELQAELNNFCRDRAQNRESLNRMVYDEHLPHAPIKPKKGNPSAPARTIKQHKHVSECLNANKSILSEYPATKRSAFQTSFRYKLIHLNLDELKIYQKPIFCCFQLDFCLRKPTTNELLDIQVQGMQYVFISGRLTRIKQIRDELLSHYGFKVLHVDYNYFKGKDRATEDVALMNKRIFADKR